MELIVEKTPVGDALILGITGSLVKENICEGNAVAAAFDQVTDESTYKRLILDLAQTTAIDAEGTAFLQKKCAAAKEKGIHINYFNAERSVEQAITAAGCAQKMHSGKAAIVG